jgi:hypothetical protein
MDWANRNNISKSYNLIEKYLGSWNNTAIILMHDWTRISSILQAIIDLARRRNFRFVNMDECLGNSPVSLQVNGNINENDEAESNQLKKGNRTLKGVYCVGKSPKHFPPSKIK